MRSLLTGNCIIVQIVKSYKNKKVILIRNLHIVYLRLKVGLVHLIMSLMLMTVQKVT